MTTTPAHRSAGTLRVLAALAVAVSVAACDVVWGGARVNLEEPAPPASEDAGDESADVSIPDLPRPPLLYAARLEPDGSALAVPAARLGPEGLEPLGWPDQPPEAFRDRFAAVFQEQGAELPLLAEGGRAGTLILGERRSPVNAGCPAVSDGSVLLPPGRRVPPWAFSRTAADGADPPTTVPGPPTNSRIRTFAPILAERILREEGVARPFLARQVDLQAVTFPGDTAPGMAATYVINDSLAAGAPPSGASASLFFLARFDRSDGFVPVWRHVRSYEGAEGKEILAWMGWIRTGAGPTHLVRRLTADRYGMAAFRTGAGEGELTWTEPAGCSSLQALRGPMPRSAPAAPADAGGGGTTAGTGAGAADDGATGDGPS